MKDLIQHIHNGETIHLRASDGYINATAMCRAARKMFAHYNSNKATEDFLKELSLDIGIPISKLIQTIKGRRLQATWVHPQVAIHLAQWLSPKFAVQVSEWVVTWMVDASSRSSMYPDFAKLSEDEKRLYLRDQVVSSNKKLAEAAKDSGVETPKDFAFFQTEGYKGMYGDRNVPEIREKKGLPAKAAILDHMGSAELAANLFRITQTEEKLINERISHKFVANRAHYQVGLRVRKAMEEISGVFPEDLPTASDIKKLQKNTQTARKISKNVEPSELQKLSIFEDKPINLKEDLWKYVLLIIAARPNGEIKTSELINELPNYITIPDEEKAKLKGRRDNKFSQRVRNMKSHKNTTKSFIFQGYAEDIRGGFRITKKGIDFVKSYFSE